MAALLWDRDAVKDAEGSVDRSPSRMGDVASGRPVSTQASPWVGFCVHIHPNENSAGHGLRCHLYEDQSPLR